MCHMENKKGKVWLVGAGPGDPGLFTIKGRDVLSRAEVVVYDKLVGHGVLSSIPLEAEKIFVGKSSGNHTVPQEEINEILLREALKGRRVVRLKGGDPFLFGRGGEELELLAANDIPFEIVPGITSAIAVPAYNGIPVTHRDFVSSLHIITGHTRKSAEANIDYEALVRLEGTLVFLMGVTSMGKICEGLLKAGMGKDMPAAILERGTTARQRRVVATISTLSEEAGKARISTPAIIVVGKVCSLSETFGWAEKMPLAGVKIAVTRPKDRSSYLAEQLSILGAEIVHLPTIRTEAIEVNELLVEAMRNIEDYSWIAFTSPVGVEIFFEKLREMMVDIRCLGGIKMAAIGSATKAAIEKKGIFVELMPEVYSGQSLGKLLAQSVTAEEKEMGIRRKILIPRAEIGAEDIIKPLSNYELDYVDLPIYHTLMEKRVVGLEEDIDYVAFTSASTVSGFVKLWEGRCLDSIKAICIGGSTAAAARKHGMEVLVAEKATMDSMLECFLSINTNEE